jgi:hypothetical protein
VLSTSQIPALLRGLAGSPRGVLFLKAPEGRGLEGERVRFN